MSWAGLEVRASDVFMVFQVPEVFFQGTLVLCDPSGKTRSRTHQFQVYDIRSSKCSVFSPQPTVKVFNEISHKQFICGQLPDVAVATDVVVGRAVFHSPWHGDKSSQLGGQAAHLICWSNVDADGKGRDNNICAHIFSQTMKDLRTKRDS